MSGSFAHFFVTTLRRLPSSVSSSRCCAMAFLKAARQEVSCGRGLWFDTVSYCSALFYCTFLFLQKPEKPHQPQQNVPTYSKTESHASFRPASRSTTTVPLLSVNVKTPTSKQEAFRTAKTPRSHPRHHSINQPKTYGNTPQPPGKSKPTEVTGSVLTLIWGHGMCR